MTITSDQFSALFPRNPEPQAWAEALNAIMPKYGIDTPQRIAAFLAQCGHESKGFTAVRENLNYDAAGLTRTWPSRFPPAVAGRYARQPERIANRAYANRNGNGPETSGDGWRYRGRGVIQLTGKSAYATFAKTVGKRLEDIAAYLETKAGAVESACWYWKTRNLNDYADVRDINAITIRINGGTNGSADRLARYAQAAEILAA